MHPTLLLPTVLYFVTLLTIVPVRVFFIPVLFSDFFHDLCYDVAVRKRGRVAYSSQELPH